MKKLFVHHPMFRLLSPLFSGALVYLLILLINSNIDQLKESFISQELFVCIAIAYLIQEGIRLFLFIFDRIKKPSSIIYRILIQVFLSLIISIVLVSSFMHIYFNNVLSYTPNVSELIIFNSLYALITLIYVCLFISHRYMHRINTKKQNAEQTKMKYLESEFIDFKRDINPDLLFDSLEAMLILMKDQPEKAEELLDLFATVYRYLLASRFKEVVDIVEELEISDALISLYEHLPFQKVRLNHTISESYRIVPGSILIIIERIIRSCIHIPKSTLEISLECLEDQFKISYVHQEKLRTELTQEDLQNIDRKYGFYTDSPVSLSIIDSMKTITLPKLHIHESSHH